MASRLATRNLNNKNRDDSPLKRNFYVTIKERTIKGQFFASEKLKQGDKGTVFLSRTKEMLL